jgi:hypothetical protein
VFCEKEKHCGQKRNEILHILSVRTMSTYFAGKAVVARKHLYNVFSSNLPSEIRNDLPRIIVVHGCGPTSSDAVGPVHKDHGDNRNVVFRLDI